MQRIIEKIKCEDYKSISFLVGAGASTSCGLLDFRSKNGVYDKIRSHFNLSDPSLMFNINYFRKHPEVYYEYRRIEQEASKNLKIEPGIAHRFMKHIENRNLLNIIYTQNVDGLEYKAGISETKIVSCHGRASKAICSGCGTEEDYLQFKENIKVGKVMRCINCNNPIKSGAIFFGEKLPKDFIDKQKELSKSDLVIIIGTSLNVTPFSKVIESFCTVENLNYNTYGKVVSKTQSDILLINREDSLKSKLNDGVYSFAQGEVDHIIREMAESLNINI